MKLFNKLSTSIKNKYNSLTHSTSTGAKLTPIKDAIDDLTQTNTTRVLNKQELIKLRAVTVVKTVTQVGTGVAAGVVLGKSAFTGVLMGVGAYLVTDIIVYKPMQSITNKVLTVKTK